MGTSLTGEIVKNEMIDFQILDCKISLFSSDTCFGWGTWAEVGDSYYYLGDQYINIETATDLYQFINNRLITKEEAKTIMDENIFKVKSSE